MYRKLLTGRFFRDNPYKEDSVQRFVYSVLLDNGLEKIAQDIFLEHMTPGEDRLKIIADEKAMIAAQEDPEAIFQLLRKRFDPISRTALLEKTLEHEQAILPKVVEKLIRSDQNVFIENAVRLLARSENDYSAPLRERYHEIRSPYVRSLACLVLGIRGSEDTIPWMMDRYHELKKAYPDETYEQGPLLALHELNAKFYIAQ